MIMKVVRRGPKPGAKVELSLREIRDAMGKTQEEIARSLHIDQAEVSRREHRSDALVSNLREYAEALGLGCEITFVSKKGHRIVVMLDSNDD